MTEKQDYAVKVSDLTVAYDTKPVLWDIDLEIPTGKLVAVIGPNGAGKTTLLKAMLGLLKPISGTVHFSGGIKTTGNQINKVIGYVPQSESVDWDFPATVLDIVLMGRYGHLGWFKRAKKADQDLAMEMLKKVNMEAFSHRQIAELSGGQQQRVFLARALVQQADIYFMDEPFKGVDVRTERTIVDLLKDLKDSGKTVVVVHHDLDTVADYFDWVTLINMQVIACGPVDKVFNEENLCKTYRSTVTCMKGAI